MAMIRKILLESRIFLLQTIDRWIVPYLRTFDCSEIRAEKQLKLLIKEQL